MKNILIFTLAALSAFGATHTVSETTLAAAINGSTQTIRVASATNISVSPATGLYVGREYMSVVAVSGVNITVTRGSTGTAAVAHVSGEKVLATRPDAFYVTDPYGASCVTASVWVDLWVNISSGTKWKCSATTLNWVPFFGTANSQTAQLLSSTATASVAGATAISGPFLKISGTAAITAFTMPVGWSGQGFAVYPTGAFTITATSNICKAATAVADRVLFFVYDAANSCFSPSY